MISLKKMMAIWKHSREVAALSFVLAKITPGFNPEHALLAGLLHDIGAIPIITYADKHPDILEEKCDLDLLINQLKGEVGAAILTKWNFSEDLVATAREAENWLRQPGENLSTVILSSWLNYMQWLVNPILQDSQNWTKSLHLPNWPLVS